MSKTLIKVILILIALNNSFGQQDSLVNSFDNEELLVDSLRSSNDSIAMDAFIKLTSVSPDEVIELLYKAPKTSKRINYSLPIFPTNFLIQLSFLTEYCRTNQIDYKGTTLLFNEIKTLQSDLTFAERRALENKMISTLTLNEITSFEYWALVNQQSWNLTYSAGRILDIFYSKNWSDLLLDKKHLDCYLKKSILFDRLGIIGICNDYLKKFKYSSEITLNVLKNHKTSDPDITKQIAKIDSLNKVVSPKEQYQKTWEGNKDYRVINLKSKLKHLTTNVVDSALNEELISTLLSKISYKQIPIALNGIETYHFQNSWEKYSFMKRDWGFFMVGDFNNKDVRDNFLKLYYSMSEYELYSYYLDLAQIDYKNSEGKLDYDKIYELIKYNVVVAFSGGGGGSMDNEVYSLIKLLEINFKTTLGFPRKLCNSDNVWGCDSQERTKAWMNYLTERKLLRNAHNEPISFHYD